MRVLKITPDGWECRLDDCRPGFFIFKGCLCFKTKYAAEMQYYNEAGEHFVARGEPIPRGDLIVQPVTYDWETE